MSYRWILRNIQLIFVKPDSLVKYLQNILPLRPTHHYNYNHSDFTVNIVTEWHPKCHPRHSDTPTVFGLGFVHVLGLSRDASLSSQEPVGSTELQKTALLQHPTLLSVTWKTVHSLHDLKGGLQSKALPSARKKWAPNFLRLPGTRRREQNLIHFLASGTRFYLSDNSSPFYSQRKSTWVVATWD